MQFTLATCLTAFAALASAYTPANTAQPPSGNPIGHPELGELIPAGQSYTITWSPTSGGKLKSSLSALYFHSRQKTDLNPPRRQSNSAPAPRPFHQRGAHSYHRGKHPQHRLLRLALRAHHPRSRRHRVRYPIDRRRHRRLPILASMRCQE
jgi:hypothetical protein